MQHQPSPPRLSDADVADDVWPVEDFTAGSTPLAPTLWGDAQPVRDIPSDQIQFNTWRVPITGTPIQITPRQGNWLRRRVLIEWIPGTDEQDDIDSVWIFSTQHPTMDTPIAAVDPFGNTYYLNGWKLGANQPIELVTCAPIFALAVTAGGLVTNPTATVCTTIEDYFRDRNGSFPNGDAGHQMS